MLSDERLVAFLATADAERARGFYEGVLGLTLHDDNEHLITFASGASRVSLQKSPTPITPPHGRRDGLACQPPLAGRVCLTDNHP